MTAIRVLHVDDDEGLLELAATFLGRYDLDVTSAASVDAGLKQLENGAIDCVVSDYQMPGRDGLAFLETVRERDSELPFILFTGEGSETVASEAIAAGVTGYLRKEATTSQYEVLANRIRRAVNERRTASRLEGRERMLRTLVDNLSGVLYRTRLKDETTEILTGRVRELTGRPAGAFLDGEVHWTDLIHEDDRNRVRAVVRDALAADEPFETTYRMCLPDRTVWVVNYGRGVPRGSDHEAVEGFVVDVERGDGPDHRVRALHEELHRLTDVETPEEVADLVATTAATVLGYPMNGVRLYDEETGVLVPVAVTEETRERMGERPVYDATAETSYPGIVFRSGEPLVVRNLGADERVDGPDGGVRSAMYLPLGSHGTISVGTTEPDAFGETDRQLAGILAENARVTLDRVARTADLRAERDRLAALFENIPDPTVRVRFVDDEPIVEAANRAFEETFGYEESRLRGNSLDQFIVPPERRQEADGYNERIQAGEGLHGEVRRVTTDGIRDFIIHVVPQFVGGRATMGYAIYTDITEHKDRERELERQNERLDEFASVVSHDLRNPLNIAAGRLDIARETCAETDFDAVERAHGRMRDLVDGLLDLARQGRAVGDLSTVALDGVVRVAWGSADTDRMDLVVGDLPEIRADQARLSQLLVNLFVNAATHAAPEEGNVTLTVEALDDGFAVADDGQGVPTSEREAVFQSGVSSGSDGTGFGLAIVRSIAEAHGWTVTLTGSEGEGARFEFTGVERADRP